MLGVVRNSQAARRGPYQRAPTQTKWTPSWPDLRQRTSVTYVPSCVLCIGTEQDNSTCNFPVSSMGIRGMQGQQLKVIQRRATLPPTAPCRPQHHTVHCNNNWRAPRINASLCENGSRLGAGRAPGSGRSVISDATTDTQRRNNEGKTASGLATRGCCKPHDRSAQERLPLRRHTNTSRLVLPAPLPACCPRLRFNVFPHNASRLYAG